MTLPMTVEEKLKNRQQVLRLLVIIKKQAELLPNGRIKRATKTAKKHNKKGVKSMPKKRKKTKKWGKIGAPKSAKRKRYLAGIRRKRKR